MEDFKKFCDECKHLNITEYEQDEFDKVHKYRPDHKCNKFYAHLSHLGYHPKILRASVCIDENGFEPK